ncbi:GD17045 [Drosophila simulans]|uniref:GD17045 n=1 Tax=Drosophila simulans TaxID=7240 RepID=B4R373_DROSI|nr:GD17045 [Drosophila simulans]
MAQQTFSLCVATVEGGREENLSESPAPHIRGGITLTGVGRFHYSCCSSATVLHGRDGGIWR